MKKNIILAACLLLSTFSAQAQIITTIAGNGTAGNSGDGGAATSAELFYPSQVACDGAGNLYIVDINAAVRKVNTSGIITTCAGNGTGGYTGDGGLATAAEVFPNGVTADSLGNIYIFSGSYIRKVDATGIITTIAGSTTIGYTGDGGAATSATFDGIFGMCVDKVGNLYLCDVNNFVVRKIDAAGIVTTIAGNGSAGYSGDGGLATAAQLTYPTRVTTDDSGNVFISDPQAYVVRKVSTVGIISTVAGTGAAGYTGNGGAATAATLNAPNGVAVDKAGNLYIADLNNNVIRKVSAAGIISTYAGNDTVGFSGDGGLAIDCSMSQPTGITLNGSGDLFIADYQNNRIRKVTASSTGIAAVANSSDAIALYPNPNNGTFTIEGLLNHAVNETAQITVMDVCGRIAYNATAAVVAGKLQAQVSLPSSLDGGMYVVRITDDTSTFFLQFVIQN